MKTVTPQLAAHLAQENTTLCRLLRIVRADGTILRFTDFDQDFFYNDDPGVPTIAALWGPKSVAATPWWVPTNDTLVSATFGGDGPTANFAFYAPMAPWAASEMFSGNSGGPNTDFLGTTSFTKGFTFATIVSLHADTLNHAGPGSIGGIRTGVSTGISWTGADIYIGFEGRKESGADWGNWKLRMFDGVTTTLIDSGVQVKDVIDPDGFPTSTGGVRTPLSFIVSADGATVTWYINGKYVGNATVGIPTTPMAMSNHFDSLSFAGSIYYQVESLSVTVTVPSGGTYNSLDGLEFTATEHKGDGSPNNLQCTGFISADGITEHDVRARLYDMATFNYRVVNWADLTMGDMKLLSGTIGDIQMKNGQFQIDLRGLTQYLTTVIGSLYGPLCRAELFGGGAEGIDPTNHWKCRLNRADWIQNGTVLSSPDSITIVPINSSSVAEQLLMVGSTTPTVPAPAGWFDDGIITFTSGPLLGYSFEIATWDGTNLSLFGGGPMPLTPDPGDTFVIEPGCDKTKGTCFSKFNNVINHAGEADIPGMNVIGAVSRTQVPD